MDEKPQEVKLNELPDDAWLTARDVARLTGYNRSTIYNKWAAGELPKIEPFPGTIRMTVKQWREFNAKLGA